VPVPLSLRFAVFVLRDPERTGVRPIALCHETTASTAHACGWREGKPDGGGVVSGDGWGRPAPLE